MRVPQTRPLVVFLEPPLDDEVDGIYPRHPPHYAAYAGAMLEREGIGAAIVDAFHEGLKSPQAAQRVVDLRPDVVVILPFDYTRETPVAMSLGIAERLRRALPDAWIGMAGTMDEDYMRQAMAASGDLDFAIFGEYELPIVEVALARRDGGALSAIQSLALRGEDGAVYTTGPGRMVRDMDELPFPAWHLVDFPSYVYVPHRYRYSPFYPMLASRGCPFECVTCGEAVVSKIRRYRQRSVDDVIGEIRHAVTNYGAREIQFSDPTFGLDRRWAHALCDRLISEGLDIPWSALTRVDTVRPDLLEHMAAAGCWNILYGIETGSADVLKLIKKGTTLDQARETIAATKAVGIEVTASFLLGLPGEREEHLQRTIDFAIELDPDYAQFFLLKSIGQKSDLSAWGAFTEEWDLERYDFRGPVYVPHGFSGVAALKRWQQRAYRRFYLRPSYLGRMLPRLIRQGQAKRMVLGGMIALRAASPLGTN